MVVRSGRWFSVGTRVLNEVFWRLVEFMFEERFFVFGSGDLKDEEKGVVIENQAPRIYICFLKPETQLRF